MHEELVVLYCLIIPFHIPVFIHLTVDDIWIICSFLSIMGETVVKLLYKYFMNICFLLFSCKKPRSHIVSVWLIYETEKLLFKVVVPFYTPTKQRCLTSSVTLAVARNNTYFFPHLLIPGNH